MCFHSTPFHFSYKFLQAVPGLDLVIKVFGICIYLNLAFIKRHHKVTDCAIRHLIPPEGGPETSLHTLDWPAACSSCSAGCLRANKMFPSWFILRLVTWVCEKRGKCWLPQKLSDTSRAGGWNVWIRGIPERHLMDVSWGHFPFPLKEKYLLLFI